MGIAGGPWRVETRVNPGKPTDPTRGLEKQEYTQISLKARL